MVGRTYSDSGLDLTNARSWTSDNIDSNGMSDDPGHQEHSDGAMQSKWVHILFFNMRIDSHYRKNTLISATFFALLVIIQWLKEIIKESSNAKVSNIAEFVFEHKDFIDLSISVL